MAPLTETNSGGKDNRIVYKAWKMADMMTLLGKLPQLKDGGAPWI